MARKRTRALKPLKPSKKRNLSWKKTIYICLAACLVSLMFFANRQEDKDEGDIWAILIGASQSISDYRHEANTAHAYNILLRGGVPKDHIIVLMNDIVPHHVNNMWNGKLVNHAVDAQQDVENVYAKLIIDYSGPFCTPTILPNVLRGRRSPFHTGKVLSSGPKDRVFMFFSGHGEPGVLFFPFPPKPPKT